MKRRSLLRAGLLLPLSLMGGCFGGGGRAPHTWWVLQAPGVQGSAEPDPHRAKISLVVEGVAAGALYDGTALVYSRGTGMRAPYLYASWSERPAVRLARLAQQRLQARGGFRDVTLAEAGVAPDLLLTLTLDRLDHDLVEGKEEPESESGGDSAWPDGGEGTSGTGTEGAAASEVSAGAVSEGRPAAASAGRAGAASEGRAGAATEAEAPSVGGARTGTARRARAGNGGELVLALTATLIDWHARRPVAWRRFSAVEPVATANAAGAVAAAGGAAEAVLAELAPWVEAVAAGLAPAASLGPGAGARQAPPDDPASVEPVQPRGALAPAEPPSPGKASSLKRQSGRGSAERGRRAPGRADRAPVK